jgi:hypothetical protein
MTRSIPSGVKIVGALLIGFSLNEVIKDVTIEGETSRQMAFDVKTSEIAARPCDSS